MSKKFTKDCRKIAVCLYGQYRTGDYVLPYMQKTAQQVNYSDVDFFCSGKQSNSYAYSQSAVESGIHLKKVMPAKKVVQSIINSKLDAKKINIVSDSIDKEFERQGALRHSILYSMADSLRLKTQYEIENDFVYDIVVLTRYDTFIYPTKYLEYLRRWYNTVTLNHYEKAFGYNVQNSWLITQPLWTKEHGAGTLAGLQDILLIGSSVAMDQLATELQYIVHSVLDIDASETLNAYNLCGHTGLYNAVRSAGIGHSNGYGNIDKNGDMLLLDYTDIERDNSRYMSGIKFTLLRESWDIENMIKKYPLQDINFNYWQQQWQQDRIIFW